MGKRAVQGCHCVKNHLGVDGRDTRRGRGTVGQWFSGGFIRENNAPLHAKVWPADKGGKERGMMRKAGL